MTAKEYLSQARILDARITSKWENIQRLQSRAEHCTMSASNAPHGGNADWTALIDRLNEKRNELNADMDTLINKKLEIETAIHAIGDPRAELVLELRYLVFWDWNQIADAMHYDRVTIWRIHGEALRRFSVPCE